VRVTPGCDSINSINISSAVGVQVSPDVAFGDSNYLVVWSDGRNAGRFNIYGSRVTPTGTVLDPSGVLIGPATETFQLEPSVAFTGAKFLVVWAYYSTPFAVAGRFVNCDCTLGDTVRIADIAGEPYRTSVAYDGTNFLVVWTQYPDLLKGQLVSTDGSLIGSSFTIAAGVTTLASGSLCFDGSNYMVIYTVRNIDIFEIWGRQYDTSGNPLGPAFNISNPAHSSSDGYVVAGTSNYFNVWAHMDYPSDIYGNVDVAIGIDTDNVEAPPDAKKYGTTIISGPLRLPAGLKSKVYDITGREVTAPDPVPGIYFIQIERAIIQKIIKIR
jgi:hypothetical protein